jgi:hypothetical protein
MSNLVAQDTSPSAFELRPMAVSPEKSERRTGVRHRSAWKVIDVAELWQSRALLFYRSWRDIKSLR